MIRTFLSLVGLMLACAPLSQAQTRIAGPVRIQIPRVNVQPVLPANPGRNYLYQNRYPIGYVPVPGQQPLPNGPNSIDRLNGLLVSRIPGAQSNPLNFRARSDVPYTRREVADVQQNLRRLGYYTGMADGKLGPETEAAIRNYQATHGQPVTGLLDSGMLSRLGIITRSR